MKRPGCAQVAHKGQRVGPRVNLSERAAHELDGRIHCTTAIHDATGHCGAHLAHQPDLLLSPVQAGVEVAVRTRAPDDGQSPDLRGPCARSPPGVKRPRPQGQLSRPVATGRDSEFLALSWRPCGWSSNAATRFRVWRSAQSTCRLWWRRPAVRRCGSGVCRVGAWGRRVGASGRRRRGRAGAASRCGR